MYTNPRRVCSRLMSTSYDFGHTFDRNLAAFIQKIPPKMEDEEKAKREKLLGNEAYRKRDFDLAMEHYLKAVELDPKEMAFLSNAAAVRFEEGKWAECAEFCSRAAEVGRANGAKVESLQKALFRRHRALAKSGDASGARFNTVPKTGPKVVPKSVPKNPKSTVKKIC